MGEFAKCLSGIKAVYTELSCGVRNVSFYNGTNKIFYPTPVIGGVGLIKNYQNLLIILKKIIVVALEKLRHLEQSCFLKENYSINEGMLPEINL